MMKFIFCWMFGLILMSPNSAAQNLDPRSISDLERDSQQANDNATRLEKERLALQKEIEKLKTSLDKTTLATAQIERESDGIKTRLSALTRQTQIFQENIVKNRENLIHLLGILQRVDHEPPPAFIGPAKTMTEHTETAALIAGVSRMLQIRSQEIENRMRVLEEIKVSQQQEQSKLNANERVLLAKREVMQGLVSEKSKLENMIAKKSERERTRAEQLAADALSLRDLISSFEKASRAVAPRLKPEISDLRGSNSTRPNTTAQTPPRLNRPVILPPDTKRFSEALNSLRAPVNGTVTKRYGRSGQKGITITTQANADVTSPYAGRIEFSGPFKNYEHVVILNVGGNYFILMTGLGEVYAKTGEDIVIGERLGVMPAGNNEKPELYIEFRKDGQPIDPKPWLGTALAKL